MTTQIMVLFVNVVIVAPTMMLLLVVVLWNRAFILSVFINDRG